MEFPVDKRIKTEFESVSRFQSSNLTPIAISSSFSDDSSSSSSSDGSFGFDSLIYSNFAGNGIQDKNNKRNSTEDDAGFPIKKQKLGEIPFEYSRGFLAPLPLQDRVIYLGSTPITMAMPVSVVLPENCGAKPVLKRCKQFWKAGDYEVQNSKSDGSALGSVGMMDHIRVHPKFLHSNATSHKWALGAFAELLDNSLDEVCYGATYVSIHVTENTKDNSKMLLIEDNGGGMNPNKMRACMSLGYSEKSKMANTIGQYGNGFKTSTMRLGEDVIVFSKTRGDAKNRPTRSIGLLSSSFLMGTGKQDIVVPMIDFEEREQGWTKLVRSTEDAWNKNLEIIVQWSPYLSEQELLKQFDFIEQQGTRVVIYNLWGDDEGQLELDFETDKEDIQMRGVNRDEKSIEMAKNYTHSRHYLTYRHSLRSYASILYLRLPANFRIILRGNDVKHHNIVEDMMHVEEKHYKPKSELDKGLKDSDMVATVKLGFVKDAKFHVDVQGFNVYHKNRLIMPFWRVWTAAGSNGRGVIGVLEANFVKPAHDKQGFERTTILDRLKEKLRDYQKTFWNRNSHHIGYAGNSKQNEKNDSEIRDNVQKGAPSSSANTKSIRGLKEKSPSTIKNLNISSTSTTYLPQNQNGHCLLSTNPEIKAERIPESSNSKAITANGNEETLLIKLKEENQTFRERLDQMAAELESEKEKSKSLELQVSQLKEAEEDGFKKICHLLKILDEEKEQHEQYRNRERELMDN